MTPSKGNPKVQVRLEPEYHRQLLQMTEELSTTVSAICRNAIINAIEEHKRRKGFVDPANNADNQGI